MASDRRKVQCPAILIAAPGFNQGRTTITATLARYHRNQGRRVRVLKAGPDFLDPLLYQCASGHPVDTLDLWLVGEAKSKHLLHRAASESDLLIIDSSAGLYDTNALSSQLAVTLGVPIMVVVDGSCKNQNSQDFIDDLVTLSTDQSIAGVLINRVSSDYQPELLANRLQQGISYFGHLPEAEALKLPVKDHRLLVDMELEKLDLQLDQAAKILETAGLTALPEPVTFYDAPQPQMPALLEGIRVGVAKDEAFGFIYHGNLELLSAMGAEIQFFSPIHDTHVPNVDSLWFPGGFPELYLDQLSSNSTMKASIREFHSSGRSILAECGGMLYMMGSLTGASGLKSRMVGLLSGNGKMLDHLSGFGMQSVKVDDQVIRGYVFHHSRMESAMEPVTVSDRRHGLRPGETLYRLNGLYASYVHFYFPSHPLLTARFFGSPIFANPDY
ncbi:cobyrinate a,c-diamide synthase [Motiliproteus sp. MSK22-1]|uniref:cobyrinate a,c-diamide synthase n=1 Tax=Motiliproteus sp. MSK22-1 TaxID=1897630 RepID=UPI000975EDBD|nr:cobyrinate a,c-diamide synthase [Motiliproteus sp. MSK22-1]OMH33290.1 hypothetical protein BGP75_13685 [Motiliproteus sp. MSK22-1]